MVAPAKNFQQTQPGIVSRQVEGSSNASVQNDHVLHFGLDKRSEPVDLEILRAGISVQTVSQHPVDPLHTILTSTSKVAN
jgi:hypothetical protein